MRFVDEATITVKAGKGGNGCLSFRREKYIPRGGPDGGNGGEGGSIYARGTNRLLSLYDFRLQRVYEAQNGQGGMGSQCDGRQGEDLILELPLGTQVYERTEDGEFVLADLSDPEALMLIAKGGRGGKGNEHFKSSTHRAPRFAQKGEAGEARSLRLELKILADAGLLGLPNAGKSTFLTRISAARPKIAAYPFTTLEPQLGVLIDEYDPDLRMVLADIPGLIEGASQGLGLGHRFLRHVERTRFLVHLVSVQDIIKPHLLLDPDTRFMDAGDQVILRAEQASQEEAEEEVQGEIWGDNPWSAFDLINEELALFDDDLAMREQIEVVSKIDLLSPELLKMLRQKAIDDGRRIFFICALQDIDEDNSGDLPDLIKEMWRLRDELDQHEALVRLQNVDGEEDDFSEVEVIWVRD